jgi:hypothetical protein
LPADTLAKAVLIYLESAPGMYTSGDVLRAC